MIILTILHYTQNVHAIVVVVLNHERLMHIFLQWIIYNYSRRETLCWLIFIIINNLYLVQHEHFIDEG